MGKLKRKNPTQQTKWEKSSKAIGISLTLIQLANMYSPIIPRAGAEAMPSEYSSSSENNTDSVNNDVYGTPSVEANPTFRLQSSEISSSSGISLIDFRPTSSGLTSLIPTLGMSFSKQVQLGTGAISIYRSNDKNKVEEIKVSSGRMEGATYNLSGSTLQIYTNDTLPDQTEYYVNVDPSVIVDEYGAPFSGVTGEYTWTFRTPDFTAPKASFESSYDSGLSRPIWLKMQFDESIHKNYGSIIIRNVADNSIAMKISTSGGSFYTESGQSVFSYIADNAFHIEVEGLNSGTSYYVDVTSGTFSDNFDNAFPGIQGTQGWNFKTVSTADTTNPSLVSHSASKDSLSPTLYLTFDEDVELGDGAITIYRNDNGQVVENLLVSSGHLANAEYMQPSGAQSMQIYTMQPLEDQTDYYVSIAPNTFKDKAGNYFSGLTGKDWMFRTPDRTNPQASYATIYPEQIGDPMKLTLSFNEDVQLGSYGSVVIRQVEGDNAVLGVYASGGHFNVISGSLYLNQSGNTFYLEAYGLSSGVQYYVDIESGMFMDKAGNGFEGLANPKEWSFKTVSTADTTNPSLVSHSASKDSLSPTLYLTFDEDVELGDGAITIYRNDNGQVVENLLVSSGHLANAEYMQPSGAQSMQIYTMQPLEDQTDYYVSIAPNTFKDKAGNHFSGLMGKDWTFRTPDRTAPEAKFSTNYNSGVGAPIWIGLEFNEQVRPSTGNIIIRNEATGEKEMVIHASSGYFYNEAGEGVFSYEDNNRFYLQTQDLNSGATYYVDMSSGMFVDIAGNVSAAVNAREGWSFTISNQAKGDIVSVVQGILENQTIRNLPVQLTAGELLRGLTLTPNAYALVYNSNGSPVNSATVITTGMQVKVWSTNGTSKSYSLEVEKSTSKKSDSDKKTGNNQPSTPVSFAPTNPVSSTPMPTATGGSGGAQPQGTTGNSSNNGTSSIPSTTNPSSGNTAPVITSSPNVLVIVAPVQAVADTVSLQANSPSTNALVYYYDNNWDKWIAVPTTRENNNLKASVPQGAWTSVIANSNMAQPQDTINSWANKDILKLMSLDIVQGDAAGSYNPQQAVNRYEMAVMLAKVLRLDIPTVSAASVTTDNSAMPAWAEPYVQAVSAQGIMVGDNNGFNGTRSITREQLATMIGRMLPTSTTTTLSPVDYKDAKKVSAWATQGVQKVNTLGLMSGYPDQTFRPNQEVTREEMAAVLSKLVDILPS